MDIFPILFGSIFSFSGIILLVLRFRSHFFCRVQTEGVISDVKKRVGEGSEVDRNGGRSNYRRKLYSPVYQYGAQGRTITEETYFWSRTLNPAVL